MEQIAIIIVHAASVQNFKDLLCSNYNMHLQLYCKLAFIPQELTWSIKPAFSVLRESLKMIIVRYKHNMLE